jgi:molybdopterin molybdotransferase
LVTLEQAWKIIHAQVDNPVCAEELIPVEQSMGRICASQQFVQEDYPPFTRSSVDGYAVMASDTHGASHQQPILLKISSEIRMGQASSLLPGSGRTALIHTGGMMPENADAVIMIEETENISDDEILIYKSVSVRENVIYRGEDVHRGNILLEKGKRITEMDAGALSTSGVGEVSVYSPVRVGILSMGDELIDPQAIPLPGQIRDINSIMLAGLCRKFGGEVAGITRVRDQPKELLDVLKSFKNTCDLVFITAGSSVSTRDYTARVIQEFGKPGVLFHGIHIRPGKPTIFARCGDQVILGLPGNPVSAFVIAWLLGMPILKRLAGESPVTHPLPVDAILDTNVSSQSGRAEYIPVRLQDKEGISTATPIFFKSNLIFSLARADGLMYIPEAAAGISAGTRVKVFIHSLFY